MSPHAVNNFVSDLVLMAQAMERLPQVEHELASARQVLIEMDKQADSLRSDIAQAKDYAAKLEAALHDAEVAKDLAETMFLEADDRTARALDFVKAQFGAAGSLIQALEPPKPMPDMKELGEEIALGYPGHADQPQVSEVKPIAADPTASETHSFTHETAPVSAETSTSVGSGHLGSIDPTQGQGEPEPMVQTVSSVDHALFNGGAQPDVPSTIFDSQREMDPTLITETAHMTESVSADTAKPLDTVTGTTSWATTAAPDTKSQPYAGRKYKDVPYYVPLDLWLDGGGNKLDYSY